MHFDAKTLGLVTFFFGDTVYVNFIGGLENILPLRYVTLRYTSGFYDSKGDRR